MSTDRDWPLPIEDRLATPGARWLEGKTALVAGGGLSGPIGNIGFAIAWHYAQLGANVVVLDRDEDAGRRTVDAVRGTGVRAEHIPVDLLEDASVEAAVARAAELFGSIDAVATTVGGGGSMPLFDADIDDWHRAIDVNCTSAWLLMRHVRHHMPRGGSIVTVSSIAAEPRGPALPYGVAKTALEKLSVDAATSLAGSGIRVNCVRIGMIWGAFAARGMTELMRDQRRRNVALQTEGNPWDIAAAVSFLSTDQARWISGQVIAVDGGGFAPRDTGAVGTPRKADADRE